MKNTGCIVTYNNIETIEECLRTLYNYISDDSLTLYVSDNGSTDGTIELIRSNFPQVVIIENKANLGFGKGHNRILPYLTGMYHFVINPDLIFTSNVIKELVTFMENNLDVAMVTPQILNLDGSIQYLPKKNPTIRYLLISKIWPFYFLRKEYTREQETLNQTIDIDFCTGCFFCIRSKCFLEVKGFDDRYFMYFEDSDLSRKIHKKYEIKYYPSVSVYHKWKRENVRSLRGIIRYLHSMILYFTKWGWKL